ncbi:hypothetical protein [Halorhabdus salina]|uniref:hypothetical protein n=1 Tax=Halorhabdus salina TaxID=2750670 RepID=UPI0015EE7799|nr:hypothetical protein [Halorhabdus salina]
MSEADHDWNHAGISKIKDDGDTKYARVPDRVFREEEILILNRSVDWYFNDISQTLIVTHNRLDEEDYEYTGVSTKFLEGNSKYGLTIPKVFYDSSQGVRGTGVKSDLIDEIELPVTGFLHFVYHSDMAEGDKKSCYVLTDSQFDVWVSDSDAWDGSLDQTPRFF